MTHQEPQFVDVSLTVLKERLDARGLCKLLQEHLESVIPVSARTTRNARVDYEEMSRSVSFFGTFLDEHPELADANESMLTAFKAWLERKSYKPNTVFALVRHVRNLINGLPTTVLNRPVLDDKAYAKATRLNGLTADSKKLLADYLRNGCRLRGGRLSVTPLKESCKENAVGAVLRLMNAAKKNDVFTITEADAERFLEQYTDEGKRNSAVDQLATARQFFAVLLAKKLIPANPLDRFTSKAGKVDGDFIAQEGIAKLQDLSTLNMSLFDEVRNRLLAFTLCYDFALRIGEAAQLLVTDVSLTEFVDLTIRSEIQKGSNKPKVYQHSYFDESKTLMTTYLKLRAELHPQTDALLISYNGNPLGETGSRDAVAKHCLSLDIKTTEGRRPNPHRLRHSFGTLNVQPLGLALDVYDVMQRLRHSDLKTTTQIYITNNHVLQRERHVAVMSRRTKPVEPLYQPPVDFDTPLEVEFVAEWNVIASLREKKITWQGLRKFCKGMNTCRKNGKAWSYSKTFIMDLAQNWASKREACQVLHLSNSGFYYWVQASGVRLISIGKATFVPWSTLRKALNERVA